MKKILIVEPDEEFALPLQERLRAEGYEVIRASAGDQGLKLARSQKPDLILVELLLPRMDGCAFIRLLKFDQRFHHIPIVVVTARRLAEDVTRSREAGAEAFVTKPIAAERLVSIVHEQLDKGTSGGFQVEVVAPLPAPRIRPPPGKGKAVSGKKKILVVENDGRVAQALQQLLEPSGFEVTLAEDGDEGLKAARREEPDLVILETMLPRMDGYAFTHLLKFDRRFQDVPVVILTARRSPRDLQMGKEVGADAYVIKPFDPARLVSLVDQLLRERAARGKRFVEGRLPLWIDGLKTIKSL